MKRLIPLCLIGCITQVAHSENPDWVIIPFTLVNKIILVQAEVDNKTGWFVLDTGVSALTLNRKYFNGFEATRVFTDINGNESAVQLKVVDLSLDAWIARNLSAEVVEFQAVEASLKRPILGNIGTGAFRGCELVLDYVFREITIYQLDAKGKRNSDYYLHTNAADTVDFQMKGEIPVIEAIVGAETIRLGLDTGAGINLWEATSKLKIGNYWQKGNEAHLTGVVGRTQGLESGQIFKVRIGKMECLPMSTIFTSLTHLNLNTSGRSLDGIIGYEWLSQFRVAINFRKRQICLWDKETVEVQLAMHKERENMNKK